MKSLLFENQSGQALIEALLALAFVVVIITAVVIAVINALNNTTFTKNQNLATQYAQEGLDIARNMKDTKYDEFKALSSGGSYCAQDNGAISAGTCTLGEFTKQLYINHSGLDQGGVGRCETGSSFVSSTVSWTDSKCTSGNPCHRVQLDSCFSDPNRLFGT